MPAITFSGIGSGIDTEALVSGLMRASEGPLAALQRRQQGVSAAVTTLSDLGGLLSSLRTAVEGLDTAGEVGSYGTSSSTGGIVATANGTASPGAYDIVVEKLAREQRTYSGAFGSATAALGQSGTLDLQIGTGAPVSIAIDAADSLGTIASKINSSGLRVSASLFFDGTEHRLQLRGLDSGVANAVGFTENGTALGLSTVQAAQDAKIWVDGFPVSSATNKVTGAIQGVTLALTAESPDAVRVEVSSNPSALTDKVKAVVTAYNAVISKIHLTAGFGTVKGSSAALKGDSALRTISSRLADLSFTSVGSGPYRTLASIGIELTKDGAIKLDEAKLTNALSADAAGVATVLAGTETTSGVMDLMRDLVKGFADPGGTLTVRKEGLEARDKSLTEAIDRERQRLSRMEDALRKQFTSMDTTVAANLAQLNYVQSVFVGRK